MDPCAQNRQQLRLVAPTDTSDEALHDLLGQADAIVAQTHSIGAELLNAAPRLKLVQC